MLLKLFFQYSACLNENTFIDGFINGQGIIDTSLSPDYWLHIAPTSVAVPAAVWLSGTSLLGLVGMADAKKRNRLQQYQ
jgi:hypothetical protein